MMDIVPRFAFPLFLLLLALVPWSIYIGMRIRSLRAGRKWTAITLRTMILLCIIGALAGAEIVKKNDQLAVFFLLDQSNSIPQEQRQAAAQWVRNATDAYMSANVSEDQAGVIVFGDDASIEQKIGGKSGLDEIRSYIEGDGTDLAEAIRLAMAAFPQGFMRRVVILSDGNETEGSILEETKIAQAAGVEVNTVPLHIESGSEVRVREVTAPGQTSAGEPFQLRIVVYSDQDAPAVLQVYQRAGNDRRMLPPQDVQLQQGDNVFLLTQELTAPGFYEYEVNIESPADTVLANNVGRTFTTVQGEPTLLFVESAPENAPHLIPALEAEGLQVEQVTPFELPTTLAQFQAYDAVVLSDISATDLTSVQLNILEAMVRDHGIGLVMLGGPNTFGAGGFLDTPVEKALPVSMDIKQRKILPRGALAVVMHTCEIPDGNVWAREIALAALNVLASQDLMGVLGYMWNDGDSWIHGLSAVGDKRAIARAIRDGAEQIGDMPDVGPTLKMAYTALNNADAAVKRVIMISDGDPAAPGRGLLNDFAAAKIAVSTICIAPHSSNDQNMLKAVANATGGTFYFVSNPNNLPQIFTKEAAVVKRGLLIEEEFTPLAYHDSELLYGVADKLPALLGYVVTTPKENATVPLVSHEDDPVLAHWRYGLGKAVAFTSDVSARWATQWLGWEGFNRFWAQTMRWAMRDVTPSNFQVTKTIRDGKGHIRIDAVDEQGKFVNFLRPGARVTAPDFAQIDLELSQTGPGIYEGSFPVDTTGVYVANIAYETPGGEQQSLTTGLSLDYSREYEYNTSNLPLLEHVAAVGGGKVMTTGDNPFEHNLSASATVTPLWTYLLAIAACLLPLEIFVRRVMLPYGAMFAATQAALRRVPGVRRIVPAPKRRAAPATGTYRAATEAQRFEFGQAAPPASFGEVAPPPSMGTTPETPSDAAPKPAPSAYTQQLLAAKERAIKGKKSRLSTRRDTEEDSDGKR
jgi:uncharacterized membrane protein